MSIHINSCICSCICSCACPVKHCLACCTVQSHAVCRLFTHSSTVCVGVVTEEVRIHIVAQCVLLLSLKKCAMQVKVQEYVAGKKHQAAMDFNLYACLNNSDRYVDADAMKKVGLVRLHIADPKKVTDPDAYKFTVNFRLGGSELTVTAVDKQTGEEVQTSVIFVAE